MNKKNILAVPYVLWAILFTIVPLFIVLLYSFTKRDAFGGMIFSLTFENYKMFFEPIYLNVLWRSLRLSLYSTIACFMIGYPMAYIISKSDIKKQSLMIMLFILPLWTNFLLRTYAWMVVLREQGALNELLLLLGIIDEPLQLLYTNGAVIMGMVYNFLPFMILQINTALTKMDKSLLEAAQDLGANKFQTFWKVIFPLSLPGVVSGITLVFLPAVSSFFIPKLLGGGQFFLIGNVIENQFITVGEWNFGSAISMIMAMIMMLLMMLVRKLEERNKEEK